jgi:hypothetical protein
LAARVAAAQARADAARTAYAGLGARPERKFQWSDLSLPLISAGLGMMASRSPYLGVAIGEGGLGGVSTYVGQEKERRAAEHQKATEGLAAAKMAESAQQHADTLAQKSEAMAELKRQHDVSMAKPIKIGEWGGREIYGVPDKTAPGGYRVIDPQQFAPRPAAPPPAAAPQPPAAAPVVPPAAPPAAPAQPPATAPAAPGDERVAGAYAQYQPNPAQYADAEGAVRSVLGEEDAAAPLRRVLTSEPAMPGLNMAALDDPQLAADPGRRARILAIATGRAPFLPTGRSNRENNWMMNKAFEVNPNLDANMYPRRQRVETFFSVGTQGGGGQNIVAFNRFIAHSGSLLAIAEALDQGQYEDWNKVRNTLSQKGFGWLVGDAPTRQDALGRYQAVAEAVSGEAAKVLAGQNTALADRNEWREILRPGNPTNVIRSKIKEAVHLGEQALAANVAAYNEGTRQNAMPREFMTDGTRAVIKALKEDKPITSLVVRPAAMADQDRAALDWANKNPNDPRAADIKRRLGVQ